MKKRYIIFGLLAAVLIAMLVSAIRAATERHRRTQDMEILQMVGRKMQVWGVNNGETLPSLTNKSFLATLGPDETAFLMANRITTPSGTNDGYVVLLAETQDGRFALYVDGSVQAIR